MIRSTFIRTSTYYLVFISIILATFSIVESITKRYVFIIIRHYTARNVGRGSSVGIGTRYGLDGPGIESPWGGGRFSAIVHRVFPGGKAVGAWR